MNILLVKLSSLGDVVHTLPVLQDIRAALPDAQIDWALEPAFAPLLAGHPDVRRVLPCALRRWRTSPLAASTRAEWRAFKADLQRTPYDAIIDLQGLSKSALVSRLARLAPGGLRYAMANATDGSGYEAPTRWAADVAIAMPPRVHAVQRGRLLAAAALGYSLKQTVLPLYFGIKQAEASGFHTNSAIKLNKLNELTANKGSVVLIHGTSRADKQWPLAHWVALGQRLLASGYGIALVHGNASELATSQAIAEGLASAANTPPITLLPLMALDALAHTLSQCAGAIGVDSGVSHIAVALGLPHVQLYNFDTAWRTGPVNTAQQVSVYAQPTPTADAVWLAWLSCAAAACATTAPAVPQQAGA